MERKSLLPVSGRAAKEVFFKSNRNNSGKKLIYAHLCRMQVSAENLSRKIFEVTEHDFNTVCLEVFHFQYRNNIVYKSYCDLIKRVPSTVRQYNEIPFLPISLFKRYDIKTTDFIPEAIFESSGTTGTATSRHCIKDLNLYEKSFLRNFVQQYGRPEEYCILGLLPSYLERDSSSLVYMVNKLCELSGNSKSGFYLYNFSELASLLRENTNNGVKTLLIGVTYALLDFAEAFPLDLSEVMVMETGGMKGRKREMLRESVHDILKSRLNLSTVHSEYGMTELLSQAYSRGEGLFQPPPWMRVLCREQDDPLTVLPSGENAKGPANIIDLANLYSCAFISTDDLVGLRGDGSFEVLGRIDHSDLRGCNLLVAEA